MGILTELIQQSAWVELEATLSISPRARSALFRPDSIGRTPLHYICAKKLTPDWIIRVLLDYHQQLHHYWTHTDVGGNTVFHAAALCGNRHVMRVLLEQATLTGARFSHVNNVEMTPLIMAWKKFLSPSFTLFGNLQSPGRKSPMTTENFRLLNSIESLGDLKLPQFERLADLWHKTVLLTHAHMIAQATTSEPQASEKCHTGEGPTASTQQWHPLHDLLKIGGHAHLQCPTVAYWLALRLYRDQVSVADKQGNLPLHLAAKSQNCPILAMTIDDEDEEDYRDSRKHDSTSQERPQLSLTEAPKSTLTQLSTLYPRAAVALNHDGRLPLHLAIENGKTFENGIYSLVCAAPHTLERRDVKTKLFPFMLACTSSRSSLTLVFELVRARPDLLQIGLPDRPPSPPARNSRVVNRSRSASPTVGTVRKRLRCSPSYQPS